MSQGYKIMGPVRVRLFRLEMVLYRARRAVFNWWHYDVLKKPFPQPSDFQKLMVKVLNANRAEIIENISKNNALLMNAKRPGAPLDYVPPDQRFQ